jgi:putative ABC transport system substrate-binding protein
MQQRRLAYYSNNLASDPDVSGLMDVFRDAMLDRGYAEGQNLVIEYRYASGDGQAAEFTESIERFKPEVIVVPAATVARAVHTITTIIPIVSIGQGDLVTSGLAESLARPGGNVTGLSIPLLAGKPLELLKQTIPALQRVAVLFDATIVTPAQTLYESAAADLGVELRFLPVSGLADFEPVLQAVAHDRAGAVYILSGPVFGAAGAQSRICDLALQLHLPSMWQLADAVTRGGLMGYGPNRADMFRRSTSYVDKILRGANPADLPIEQPSLFDFAINTKTAQAIGISVPQSVLAQASEVLQ